MGRARVALPVATSVCLSNGFDKPEDPWPLDRTASRASFRRA